MDRLLCLDLTNNVCRKYRIILVIHWLLGLLTGIFLALTADIHFPPLMLSVFCDRMSIVCFLAAFLLLLLISFFSALLSQRYLLFPLAFVKAFLFAFAGAMLMNTFSASGWLMQLLLMFSDLLILPIFWWLWLMERSEGMLYAYAVAAAGIVLIVLLDYALITPFLADLIVF